MNHNIKATRDPEYVKHCENNINNKKTTVLYSMFKNFVITSLTFTNNEYDKMTIFSKYLTNVQSISVSISKILEH
jgi:hypothetical protein